MQYLVQFLTEDLNKRDLNFLESIIMTILNKRGKINKKGIIFPFKPFILASTNGLPKEFIKKIKRNGEHISGTLYLMKTKPSFTNDPKFKKEKNFLIIKRDPRLKAEREGGKSVAAASYNPDTNTISLYTSIINSSGGFIKLKESILHELQHSKQVKEFIESARTRERELNKEFHPYKAGTHLSTTERDAKKEAFKTLENRYGKEAMENNPRLKPIKNKYDSHKEKVKRGIQIISPKADERIINRLIPILDRAIKDSAFRKKIIQEMLNLSKDFEKDEYKDFENDVNDILNKIKKSDNSKITKKRKENLEKFIKMRATKSIIDNARRLVEKEKKDLIRRFIKAFFESRRDVGRFVSKFY